MWRAGARGVQTQPSRDAGSGDMSGGWFSPLLTAPNPLLCGVRFCVVCAPFGRPAGPNVQNFDPVKVAPMAWVALAYSIRLPRGRGEEGGMGMGGRTNSDGTRVEAMGGPHGRNSGHVALVEARTQAYTPKLYIRLLTRTATSIFDSPTSTQHARRARV